MMDFNHQIRTIAALERIYRRPAETRVAENPTS